MSEEKTYLKKRLIGCIMLIWFLPFVVTYIPVVKFKKLEGWVTYVPDDTLTVAKWFDGSYTPKKEAYVKEQFGLRNFFLRLRNQIYFSFLKVPTAKGIVIGKDNMLFEEKYIRSYMGEDFIGEKAMREKFRKLKYVSDTLKKLNIDLIICFAPGKATYYPEYIPDSYFNGCDTLNTNYKWATQIAKESGLNYIDYNAMFKSMKASTKFPLYPKTGVHWSVYSSHFAFDSLSKRIEKLKQKQLRHFKYDKVEWTYVMRDQDEDIGLGLNTLFTINHFEMPYPTAQYVDTLNKYVPRVIAISDSYWINMHNASLPFNVFKNFEFWYFYNQNWCASNEGTDPLYYNLKEKIEKSDVIVLMATESHVVDMGWGFIEDAYNLYTDKTYGKESRDKLIEFIRFKRWMRTEPKLMFDINEKAKRQHVYPEEIIDLEAHKMLGDEKQVQASKKVDEKLNQVIKENIKNHADWMQELTTRSTTENKPLDELINAQINALTGIKAVWHIKASNGKFLCADANQGDIVVANRDAAAEWETFTFIPLPNNVCAIASCSYKFLSAEINQQGQITATRTIFYGWETFTMERLGDDFIALKAANGKYLSLDEKTLQIVAKGETIGKNERFKVGDAY